MKNVISYFPQFVLYSRHVVFVGFMMEINVKNEFTLLASFSLLVAVVVKLYVSIFILISTFTKAARTQCLL